MTPKSVTTEENYVHSKDKCAECNSEVRNSVGVGEPHRFPRVMREEDQEHQREVKKISVDVLNDQRERFLAAISFSRFANCARRRVRPEGLVVRAPIVIAGKSESGGERQDYQSWRER